MTAYAHLERPKTSTLSSSSYDFLRTKWGPTQLGTPPAMPITYSFTPSSFSALGVQTDHALAVDRAIADWEAVANVQFTKVSAASSPDLDIYFKDIDGIDSTLALATNYFVPDDNVNVMQTMVSATIEFDNADMIDADANYFYLVAAHEVGHTLGLEHVDDPNQIMYPYYNEELSGPAAGDVAGIQQLYGAPSGVSSGFGFGSTASELLTDTSGTDVQLFGGAGDDTLTSTTGDDTLIGGIGDDNSTGGAGRDVLFDPFGDDLLQGGAGEDNLYSPDGQNRLEGGIGNDALRAGFGNDRLNGGLGDDALIADDQTGSTLWFGDDTLVGGGGNDLLEGGAGQDVFVFGTNDGTDTIGKIGFNTTAGFFIQAGRTDFEVGQDALDIRSFGFGSASQVLNKLRATSEGAVFEASNTSVTLVGVDVDALSINDFIWM